jgi:hypothetical protein
MAGVRDAWRTPGIRRREIAAGGKTRAREVCTGIGIAELTIGGQPGAAAVADAYAQAEKSYALNPGRKVSKPRDSSQLFLPQSRSLESVYKTGKSVRDQRICPVR